MVAQENRCCHRLAPLSRGRKEGDDLRCMYHGLKFAPSGKCIEIPQQDIIPSTAVVRSYPVVEQDCWVWIWMGDPALAERALIPRALNHNHPDWFMLTGELAYDSQLRADQRQSARPLASQLCASEHAGSEQHELGR